MPNKLKNTHIQTLNRAATTLIKAGDKIPDEKKDDLKKLLLETLNTNLNFFEEDIP